MLIEITNWDRYNPRKDVKASSWFRLENSFFVDPALFELTCEEKMVLISLMCMASQKQSARIKVNPNLTSALLRVSLEAVNAALLKLFEAGIVRDVTCALRGRDVDVTSAYVSVQELSSHDTYGRTDGRTDRQESADKPEASSADADPLSPVWEEAEAADPQEEVGLTPSQLAETWNENRAALPAVARLTSKRAKKVAARIREAPDPGYWLETIRRLAASSFATGKNDRGWKAGFDWLFENDTNHVKVNEGKYDDRKPMSPTHSPSPQSALSPIMTWADVLAEREARRTTRGAS